MTDQEGSGKTKIVPVWTCGVSGHEHPTKEDAAQCPDRPHVHEWFVNRGGWLSCKGCPEQRRGQRRVLGEGGSERWETIPSPVPGNLEARIAELEKSVRLKNKENDFLRATISGLRKQMEII